VISVPLIYFDRGFSARSPPRQLGNIRRNPLRLIFGEQFRDEELRGNVKTVLSSAKIQTPRRQSKPQMQLMPRQ
jgi:hypothetical protein